MAIINTLKYLQRMSFLAALFVLLSCDHETVSPEQSDSFLKFFGSYREDKGYDVKSLPDGGYVVVGSTTTEEKGKEIILIRTDAYGNEAWASKQIGGLQDDVGYKIQILSDGGFVILGSTVPSSGQSATNMYLIRTDANGDTLWTKSYGGVQNEVGFDVKSTVDGGFILIGSTESYGQGGKDVWLVKTNAQGDTLWTRTHGGENDEEGKCIIETSYGYIFTGYTKTYSEEGQANSNIFVVKVSDQGKEIFPYTYGGMNNDFGECIAASPSGGYIVSGTMTNPQNGVSNTIVIKIREQISEIEWSKMYGGPLSHMVKCMKGTADHGFVLTGTTELSPSNHNIFLLKIDAIGNQEYLRSFGGTGFQRAESVDIANDGGFIITGSNEFEGNSMVSLMKTKADGGI